MATAMAHRKRAAQWRPAKCRVGPPAAHAVFRRGADVHRAVPEIVRDAQPAHKGWRVANPGTRSCPTGTAARPWKPTLPPQPRGWGLKGRIVKPRPLPARQGAVSTAPRPWRTATAPRQRASAAGAASRAASPVARPAKRLVKPRPLLAQQGAVRTAPSPWRTATAPRQRASAEGAASRAAGPVARPATKRRRAAATSYATHGERRRAQALRRASDLVDALPASACVSALGGARAIKQVPSAAARRAAVVRLLLAKGGPDGAKLNKAKRAWLLLVREAARRGLTRDGLPASAGLVHEVVWAEARRARLAASGSRGGATVAATVRDGFLFLEQVLRMPIEASSPLVEAAVLPAADQAMKPPRHAGSLPLKVQLQLEELARAATPSMVRTMARCLLVSCLVHHVRLNDALNAIVWPDEVDPTGVVRGRTTVASKGGVPLELFAPAEGWLGPLDWLAEHLAEMGDRKHAVPDFEAKPAGKPSGGLRWLPGVATPAHARCALRDLLSLAPLRMSEAEFKALHLTTHSPHGSGADMLRFMGERHSHGFGEADARAIGHWLADKNAPQQDPRFVPGAPKRGVADGAPVVRGAMSLRYSAGEGRRGERQEQLAVRARLVEAVRAGLARFGRPWTELPGGVADWDILLEGASSL